MMRKSVVLPQPEGPRMPTTCPCTRPGTIMSLTSAVTPLRIGTAIVLERDVVDLQQSFAEAVSGGRHYFRSSVSAA